MSVIADIPSSLCSDQERLSASSMERITLTMALNDEDPAPGTYLSSMCTEQLQQIDQDMARLPSLQELKVVRRGFKTTAFSEEDQSSFKTALRLLDSRKILSF